jgi:hypothetical protein
MIQDLQIEGVVPMSTILPLFVSVDDARQMLGGIGKTRLYELLGAGALRSAKLGKRRLIRTDSILALADRIEGEGL